MPAVGREKFEEILQLVGDMGRWQMVVLVCSYIGGILVACHNMSSVFIAWVPEHHCALPEDAEPERWLPADNTSSTNFSQCSILDTPGSNASHACASFQYDIEDGASTIVRDWDLVCSRRWLMSTVQASYMLGIFCGALLTGITSDQFGRKITVVCSAVLFFGSAVCTSLANHYGVFIFLRFLTAMAGAGIFGCLFILYMEIIGTKYRALLGLSYQVSFAVGFMILPGVAYLERRWEYLQLSLSLPAILMFAFWWLLPESPRWLIMQGRLEQALGILKQAAKRNRRHIPSDDQLMKMMAEFRSAEIEDDKTEPRSVLRSCAGGLCEMGDLLRTPKMRRISIASFYNWMVVSMIYYGVSFNSASMSSSPYLAIFLAGLVEAPAVIISIPIINRFGRRLTVIVTHIITGVAILCIMAVPKDLSWLILLLSTLGKFSSSATFGILYVYAAELFPTHLRNAGLGASSTCARIGSTLAPYIVDLLGPIHWTIPSCVFGLCAVTAALTAFTFPETVGRRMPETVEDIERDRWETAAAVDGSTVEENEAVL